MRIVMNKIVFFKLLFNSECYLFSHILLNPYVYVILNRLTEIKA